jgi:predicted SprT family Zn-dependent metalloprotease
MTLTTLAITTGSLSKETMTVRLYDEFDRLNHKFFDDKLRRPLIEFSSRKSFGGYYQKQRHRIVLSWQAYLEHGLNETLNTFRHEVAHIIHQHHRQEFWELAAQLGVIKKYAASPLIPSKRKTHWYTYECPACKGLLYRKRQVRANASCGKCDSQYNPLYRLKLLKTEIK